MNPASEFFLPVITSVAAACGHSCWLAAAQPTVAAAAVAAAQRTGVANFRCARGTLSSCYGMIEQENRCRSIEQGKPREKVLATTREAGLVPIAILIMLVKSLEMKPNMQLRARKRQQCGGSPCKPVLSAQAPLET